MSMKRTTYQSLREALRSWELRYWYWEHEARDAKYEDPDRVPVYDRAAQLCSGLVDVHSKALSFHVTEFEASQDAQALEREFWTLLKTGLTPEGKAQALAHFVAAQSRPVE